MNVEDLQSQLGQCYNGSQDPNVQTAAANANQYTEMFKQGQMTKDEYTQVMSDIARTNEINRSADNLQVLEYMNVTINALISLASAVA